MPKRGRKKPKRKNTKNDESSYSHKPEGTSPKSKPVNRNDESILKKRCTRQPRGTSLKSEPVSGKEQPELKNAKIDEASRSSTSPMDSKIETATTDLSELPLKSSIEHSSYKFMNTGKHDFAILRKMPAYIDKSLIIRTVLNVASSCILLIAPRRFGKSANLSLLKSFFGKIEDADEYSKNRSLFSGLEIEKEREIMKQHFSKYPIILLDFKCDTPAKSLECAVEKVFAVVQSAYKQHAYLLSSDNLVYSQKTEIQRWTINKLFREIPRTQNEIEAGLCTLAEYLMLHFGKQVFLLVDEYDSICSNALINIDDVEEIRKIINLCVGSIACLSKSNDHVDRVVLTGISYLASMGLSHPSTNNVTVYKFQEENVFSQYYGLTIDECAELLSRKDINMYSKYNEIVRLYNGYRGKMLSMWSVMNFLNDGGKAENKDYWRNSGVISNLSEALTIPKVRAMVNKLLSSISNTLTLNYFTKIEYTHIKQLKILLDGKDWDVSNVDVYFIFLLEQGYLKVIEIVHDNYWFPEMKVEIPNDEIAVEFLEKLELFYTDLDFNLDMACCKDCTLQFDELSISDDHNKQKLKEICTLLNGIMNDITVEVTNEAVLHHVIFFIVCTCRNFRCFTEIRVPKKNPNRLDILLLSSTGIAVIIELKYNKSALQGLQQIIEKKYYEALNSPEYNPEKLSVNYFLFLCVNMSEKREITLSALLNCENNYDLEKRFDCS